MTGSFNNEFKLKKERFDPKSNKGILFSKVSKYLDVTQDEKNKGLYEHVFIGIVETVDNEDQFFTQLKQVDKNLAFRYYKWRRRQRLKTQKKQNPIEINSDNSDVEENQFEESNTTLHSISNKTENSQNLINQINNKQGDIQNLQPQVNINESNKIQHNLNEYDIDLSTINPQKSAKILNLFDSIKKKNKSLIDSTQRNINYVYGSYGSYQNLNLQIQKKYEILKDL